MKLRIATGTLVLVLLSAVLLGRANAAPARIPDGMYPKGAHVTYMPTVTNETMDCMWGFFCEGGIPVFHLRTQTDLHRVGGWGQVAGWHHNAMTFDLFMSDYDVGVDEPSISWSAAAFADLTSALRLNGYRPFGFPRRILSRQNQGGFLAEIQRNGPRDIVVAASWTGTTEIEALAMFSHRSQAARQTALADLVQQLYAAQNRS